MRNNRGAESAGRAEGVDTEGREEGGEGGPGSRRETQGSSCLPGGLVSTPAATSGLLFLLKPASSSQACGCISAAAHHLTIREPVLAEPGLSGNLWRMWPGGKLMLKGIPRPEADAHQERESSPHAGSRQAAHHTPTSEETGSWSQSWRWWTRASAHTPTGTRPADLAPAPWRLGPRQFQPLTWPSSYCLVSQPFLKFSRSG